MGILLNLIEVDINEQDITYFRENRTPKLRDLVVGEEIKPNTSGIYNMQTYTRGKTKKEIFSQLGVKVANLSPNTSVFLRDIETGALYSQFVYDYKSGYWYENAFYISKKGEIHRKTTGYNITGIGELVITDGEKEETFTILYLPDVFDQSEYFTMVQELYDFYEYLFSNPSGLLKNMVLKETETVSEIKEDQMMCNREEAFNFHAIIRDIIKTVHRIAQNPYDDFAFSVVNKSYKDYSRFHPKMEIDKSIRPGQSFYRTFDSVKTENTYENKMIKQILSDLLVFLESKLILLKNEQKSLVTRDLKKSSVEKLNRLKLRGEGYQSEIDTIVQSISQTCMNNHKQKSTVEWTIQDARLNHILTGNNIPLHESANKVKRKDYWINESRNQLLDETLVIELSFMYNHSPKNIWYLNRSIKSRKTEGKKEYYFHSNVKYSTGQRADLIESKMPISEIDYELTMNNQKSNYSTKDTWGMYGELSVEGVDLRSVKLFNKLFETLQNSIDKNNKKITIKGKVKPLCQPLVGVEGKYHPAVAGKDDNYVNYAFTFTKIDEIIINGESTKNRNEIPSEKSLEDYIKTIYAQKDEYIFCNKTIDLLEHVTQFKHEERVNVQEIVRAFEVSITELEKVLLLPFFRNIKDTRRVSLNITPVFTSQPDYAHLYRQLKTLNTLLKQQLVVKKEHHLIDSTQIFNLFEIWSFYKIIQLLVKKGWKILNKQEIAKQLKDYIERLKSNHSNARVELKWKDWSLSLYYEPCVYIDQETSPLNKKVNFLNPDYVFIFENERFGEKKVAILDAKYRNYYSLGSDWWVYDNRDVSIVKYWLLAPDVNHRQQEVFWEVGDLINTGILHSDLAFAQENLRYNSKESDYYYPYDVRFSQNLRKQIHGDEIAITNKSHFDYRNQEKFQHYITKPHIFSSIGIRPHDTSMFENWFRMLMEYHLREVSVCWKCGEDTDVYKETMLTSAGFEKYLYTCETCKEFWMKTHCEKPGKNHKLIKHIDNYHLQTGVYEWFVECPECYEGLLY